MVSPFPILGLPMVSRSLEDAQKARAEAYRLRTEGSVKLMTSLRNAEVGRPGHQVRAKNHRCLANGTSKFHRKGHDWRCQVWRRPHSVQ